MRPRPLKGQSLFQPRRFWLGWDIVPFPVAVGTAKVFMLIIGFIGRPEYGSVSLGPVSPTVRPCLPLQRKQLTDRRLRKLIPPFQRGINLRK